MDGFETECLVLGSFENKLVAEPIDSACNDVYRETKDALEHTLGIHYETAVHPSLSCRTFRPYSLYQLVTKALPPPKQKITDS
eukprot:4623794-Amphidinium_carterae.1